MQKREYLSLTLILFISIFLVVGNTPFVLAESNSLNSGSNSGSSVKADASASADVSVNSDDDSDDNDENETDDDNDNKEINRTRERIRERDGEFTISKEVVAGASGCVIKMERKIKIENGKKVEEIKRKIKCENGLEKEIQIKIENKTVNGEIRERIKYKIEGEDNELEVEADDDIEFEEESNATHYKLKAKLRNGNVTDIKIMPDTASETALERLRIRACSQENNCTIKLKERLDKRNVPRVVYNIEANKNGKFLGIFKIALRAQAEIDPETGEVLEARVPWWAFLVAGEDEVNQTDSDQTDVSNTMPVIGNETVNETEVINESENAAA